MHDSTTVTHDSREHGKRDGIQIEEDPDTQQADRGGPWQLVTKRKSLGSRIIQQAEELTELRFNIPKSGQTDLNIPFIDLTRGRALDATGNIRSARLSGVSSSGGQRRGKVKWLPSMVIIIPQENLLLDMICWNIMGFNLPHKQKDL